MSRLSFFVGSLSLALLASFSVQLNSSHLKAAEIKSNVDLKDSNAVANQVDEIIEATLQSRKSVPSKITNDEDFLRRLYLDITGTVPTPSEVTYFGLNPKSDKRSEKIDELLESSDFGKNWGGYWRDVIFSRATEQRSKAFQGTFERWIAEQIQAKKSWAEISSEIITATGEVSEAGQTGLIFAHQGEAAEIAAEVSRIFLGVQVQCANCHDHTSDKWKREDFHQLAAFFPRLRIQRGKDGNKRSYEVVSNDRAGKGNKPAFNNPERTFKLIDRDNDGQISKDEAMKFKRLAKIYDRALQVGDRNKDMMLSLVEFKELPRPQNRNRGRSEYYMPNLEDPQDKGTLTQPAYFLDYSIELKEEMTDLERRGALAEIITSPKNEWFSKAFVNRIWGEMLGRGFYMPIDDMGPTKEANFPEAIEFLSKAFAANNHDIHFLFRTIAKTNSYQRESLATSEYSEAAFAHSATTRLRSDQIFNSLLRVAGAKEEQTKPNKRGYRQNNSVRGQFATLFEFDPSTPQEDLTGDIPQALYMMNSKQIEGLASKPLNSLLEKYEDNETALEEMYLLVLSRSMTKEEKEICLNHIKESESRQQGFQDIMWSLLNSTEFISKR